MLEISSGAAPAILPASTLQIGEKYPLPGELMGRLAPKVFPSENGILLFRPSFKEVSSIYACPKDREGDVILCSP